MATVNFLYRSKKNESFLNIRLLFRHQDKDFVIGAKTKIKVEKRYWEKQHPKKTNDIFVKNEQTRVNNEINKISNHILGAFHQINSEVIPAVINKEWLKAQIDHYYNPPEEYELPKDLLGYMEKYLNDRKASLALNTIKKINVIKNLLIRYQVAKKTTVMISGVNSEFKNEFEGYCISENYALSTISIAFKFIRTICNHASRRGLSLSNDIAEVKTRANETEKIYLSFPELELIEKVKNLPENIENARDWLVISCYTGQRVSDFMRFDKSMIRYEPGHAGDMKPLIEFRQQKTNKEMAIALHPKVMEIVEKRGGEFPRPLSDPKYNLYIKEVCKLAKLNQKVTGSKKVEVKPKSKKYRKASGKYEKWELVTSHIGRRSFATNFYGLIPTSLLIHVTGHSTEVLFRKYIGKGNKDFSKELHSYF